MPYRDDAGTLWGCGWRAAGGRAGRGGRAAVREATRRGMLATGASLPLLASGCKGIGALGSPPRAAPEVAIARSAIAAEALMIKRYEAVAAAVPSLAAMLAPVVAQHREHLSRLRARLIIPAGASGPAASPAPSLSGRVPATAVAAAGYLRDAEHAAAASLLRHVPSVSPSFAQLLASIAASEQTHAQLLTTAGRI